MKKLFCLHMLLLSATIMFAQSQKAALDKLVKAETDFAQATWAPGSIKASFLKVLDSASLVVDDGHAKSAVAAYSSFPDTSNMWLHWQPNTAAVSADGQLGYTSGPFVMTMPGENGKPDMTFKGYFLSIWKQDSQQVFKLMLDGGIIIKQLKDTVTSPQFAGSAPKMDYHPAPDAASFDAALEAFAKQAATDVKAAYATSLAAAPRLLREHKVLPADRSAALQQIGSGTIETSDEHHVLASSRDLGYSYGQSGKTYFIRVWIYENSHWKILAELLNA